MTRQSNRIYSLLIVLMTVFVLVSCQKNDVFGDVDLNTDRPIAEFKAEDAQNGVVMAVDFSNNIETIDVTELRLFIRSITKQDVTVTLANDPTVVGDYNTNNGTSYTPMPSTAYSFESPTLTLTNSERDKPVRLKFKPADLLNNNYAIGLKIQSANGAEVSEIRRQVIIILSVKNKYDGVYNVTGSCVDALGQYSDNYPNDGVILKTAGLDVVDHLDPFFAAAAPINDNVYVLYSNTTGNPTLLYSPRYVFNTTTDKVTSILNRTTAFGTVAPGGPNQFTVHSPTSKTFDIKYTAISGRFTITEHWEYVGPR